MKGETLIDMTGNLLAVSAVAAAIAAALHVAFFVFESILWYRRSVWRTFGVRSEDDAAILRPIMFNQGFYNLFLAVGVGVGLVFIYTPELQQAGYALTLFALASMVLAAVVLVTSNPRLVRGALIQGIAPLVAIVLLLL